MNNVANHENEDFVGVFMTKTITIIVWHDIMDIYVVSWDKYDSFTVDTLSSVGSIEIYISFVQFICFVCKG